MTVTTATYQPVIVNLEDGVDTYRVEMEIVGPEALELWYLDADENRTLAPTDHYTARLSGVAIPIYNALFFTLNPVKIPEGTVQISVERNTPITQLLDFKEFGVFPMRDIEYTLDKHMMICQEIAYRKCDADVGGLEMTQLISFDPYTPLYANEVQFSVQKLIDILLAIATSAESCRDRPEET